MTETNPFIQLTQYRERLARCRMRLPVLLQASQHNGLLWCHDWLKDEQADVLWVSDNAPQNSWQLPAGKSNHELGREADIVIVDFYSGVQVDTLAAVSGLVRAGGLLIMLAPPLLQWRTFQDPEYQRISVEPYGAAGARHLFLTRMADRLATDTRVLRIGNGIEHWPTLPEAEPAAAFQFDDMGCCNVEQRAVVDAVIKVATGHRHRPLVLQADRGRGKSAALGIAAGWLIAQGRQIVVTAPRPEAAAAVLHFAANRAGATSSAITFVAPDALIATLPSADLVLVDEAAALAPPILSALLAHYPRVVFATTIQGYEGTGQGFSIRFSRHLHQAFPQWRQITLSQPVRWAQGDGLESVINDLLLLDACNENSLAGMVVDATATSFEDVTEKLATLNDVDLRAIHGLMVAAHYRTRPSDLRTLLDGPNVRTFVLRQMDTLLAVVLVAEEGPLPGPLADAILAGQRRPHGHLLPQTLAVHLNVAQALDARCWRIMRIAVHSQLQRQGLGEECLQQLHRLAAMEGIDLLGSVFAAHDDVLAFWQHCGYQPVRLGISRESTSGTFPVTVLQPVNQQGEALLQHARLRFEQVFLPGLADRTADWPAALILSVWGRAQHPAPALCSRDDALDLAHFLAGHKTFENASVALYHHLQQWMQNLNIAQYLTPDEQALVVGKLLQKKPWSTLIAQLHLPGIKSARQCLRQSVATLAAAAEAVEIRKPWP